MSHKSDNGRSRPSSLGTIKQLPSGRYRAFYRHDGLRFTPGRTFASKIEARDWLTTERADRARGVWKPPVSPTPTLPTLADYYDTYIASHPHLAASTERNYRQIGSRWILPRIGDIELGSMQLDHITPSTVRRWFAAVKVKSGQPKDQPAQPAKGHPARRWAQAQGMDVSPTGRLPRHVLAQWQALGSPTTFQPARPTCDSTPGFVPGKSVTAQAYRYLHAVLESARKDGIISTNPCQIKGAAYVQHPERTPATPEQVETIAAHMPDNLQAAVYLAAWSGLRRGEMFALARRHVDLTIGTIRVERSLATYGRSGEFTHPKTLGSIRSVALPAFIVTILAQHMDKYTGPFPDSLIFPSSRQTPLSAKTINSAYHTARHEAGCDHLHWHDLRHTGATLAYSVGATVRDVQARLGHTTTRAAMIYAHRAEGADQRLADALDTAYSPAAIPGLSHRDQTTISESALRLQEVQK